jgi:hypothetical protein
MTTTTNLQAQTPKEIDAQLAEIWTRQGKAQQHVAMLAKRIENYRTYIARETFSLMTESYKASLAQTESELADARDALDAIIAESDPLQAEYIRRGTWTRAYLVTNTGGHVHSSMYCASCFPSTQFAWLPEVSGDAESEIVERAGEAACTVCYPSAPVDVLKRKSTFEAPDRKAARIEREAKAAARAAKAAATGITDVDGSPLRGRYGVIKAERTAQTEAVNEIADHTLYGYRFDAEYVAKLTEALAHKRGQSVEQVTAELQAKAAAKIKRESR